MELRYENGTPATKWVIQLPVTGKNLLTGSSISNLNVEKITVVAKEDCVISYKGRSALLTFSTPQVGKAKLIVGSSKRPLLALLRASSLPNAEGVNP